MTEKEGSFLRRKVRRGKSKSERKKSTFKEGLKRRGKGPFLHKNDPRRKEHILVERTATSSKTLRAIGLGREQVYQKRGREKEELTLEEAGNGRCS